MVAASDTVSMFARVARILLDPEIPDYRVRHAVWDEVGRDRLVETAQRADQIEANTVGSYLELVTGQYCRARKFAPAVLGAFDFRASKRCRYDHGAGTVLRTRLACRWLVSGAAASDGMVSTH